MKTISIRLKGSAYSFNTHCSTLKEVMATYPMAAKGLGLQNGGIITKMIIY